jgi:CubicO group peptidase (beta-lactamase class C family)
VTALVSESPTPSLPASALSALAGRHRVPGAQLAIHHDGTITASEVGELEFGSGRRVSRDAAFPIGSITKCFTATVAMILVADGDIDLNTPVGDYLPDLGGLGDLGAAVNLRQLLSHTSGLADISGMEESSALTLRRYVVDHARSKDLVLPPGTGFSYSNPGYVLVGWLIETVTGMSWAEAVESILLQPLGIEPAFVNLPGTRPPRRPFATGHSANITTGRTQPVQQSRAPGLAPAGALAMSAVDLAKLGLVHIEPGESRLLTPAYAAQMRQAVPYADPFGLADGWGLGLATFRQQAAAWVGHDGNADGISCHLRINPADGWVIAFTSNANTGDGLWHDLLAELGQAGVPIEQPPVPAGDGRRMVPPPGCVGWYANGDVEYAVTAGGSGAIHMSIDGENFVPLTFHDDFTFSVVAPDSGRRVFGGRFVYEPSMEKVYGIQVGGRLARKQVFSQKAPSALQCLDITG